MTSGEMQDIFNFVSTKLPSLDTLDQIKIYAATAEMCEKIKPIYLRYKLESGEKFICKL